MIPLSEGLGLLGEESKEAGRDAGMEVAGEGTGECRPGRAAVLREKKVLRASVLNPSSTNVCNGNSHNRLIFQPGNLGPKEK